MTDRVGTRPSDGDALHHRSGEEKTVARLNRDRYRLGALRGLGGGIALMPTVDGDELESYCFGDDLDEYNARDVNGVV